MEGGGYKGRVCVTGGTGFIASWIIAKLLQQGYSVNTTVRDVKKDISFLTCLPGADQEENLKVFPADLSDPESFDPAIQGCVGVFHVATPVDFEGKEAEAVVTQRSIDGALGILKACLKSKTTLKRVVYTSSVATAMYPDAEIETDHLDETCWSDVESLRAKRPFGHPYVVSKTLTEKAVLEFAARHGLDLATLMPSVVVGPFICPKLPGSLSSVLGLILGTWDERFLPYNIPMIHVDDVARAHVFLLDCSDANGRYICSSDSITVKEMVKLLASKYPEHPIKLVSDTKETEMPSLSTKKLLDTGFKYEYSINDMFDDAIKCCEEKGYL